MHELEVSLRLGMMVFRIKQGFWKSFKGIEQDYESFGLRLKIGYGKVKEKMIEVIEG